MPRTNSKSDNSKSDHRIKTFSDESEMSGTEACQRGGGIMFVSGSGSESESDALFSKLKARGGAASGS